MERQIKKAILYLPVFMSRRANHIFSLFVFICLYCVVPQYCVDVIAQRENYEPDYSVYHNVSRLIKEFNELEFRYKNYIKINNNYLSGNGVSQMFMRLSNFSDNDNDIVSSQRIKVLFAFGEHAREFFPVESLLYFLKNLTHGTQYFNEKIGRKYHMFSFSSWVLSNFDIYIVALTNPDGRHFIEKTKNYCWRGTANGIDLNRNFAWNYGKEGSSNDPTDDEFRGTHAFSEPETHIFQNISRDIAFDAFISFHSGVRHVYIPYADSKSRLLHRVPFNQERMMELARILAFCTPLRPFKFGSAHKLTGYYADGTSFDYMAGVAKIPFSFAIELWQHAHHTGRSCFDEFNPHSNNLQIELALIHPLYVEFLFYLHKWKRRQSTDKDMYLLDHRSLLRLTKDESSFKVSKVSVHTNEQVNEESSLRSQMTFLVIILLLILLAYLAVKHVMYFMHKKRVISLKSLSSTFALFRS